MFVVEAQHKVFLKFGNCENFILLKVILFPNLEIVNFWADTSGIFKRKFLKKDMDNSSMGIFRSDPGPEDPFPNRNRFNL